MFTINEIDYTAEQVLRFFDVLDNKDDPVYREVAKATNNDRFRVGPYIICHTNGFTIRSSINNFVVRGKTSGALEIRERNLEVFIHHNFYAIIFDHDYREFARIYEDGHMTAIEPEDRLRLYKLGFDMDFIKQSS